MHADRKSIGRTGGGGGDKIHINRSGSERVCIIDSEFIQVLSLLNCPGIYTRPPRYIYIVRDKIIIWLGPIQLCGFKK